MLPSTRVAPLSSSAFSALKAVAVADDRADGL
jgi:hypothetical protein